MFNLREVFPDLYKMSVNELADEAAKVIRRPKQHSLEYRAALCDLIEERIQPTVRNL